MKSDKKLKIYLFIDILPSKTMVSHQGDEKLQETPDNASAA